MSPCPPRSWEGGGGDPMGRLCLDCDPMAAGKGGAASLADYNSPDVDVAVPAEDTAITYSASAARASSYLPRSCALPSQRPDPAPRRTRHSGRYPCRGGNAGLSCSARSRPLPWRLPSGYGNPCRVGLPARRKLAANVFDGVQQSLPAVDVWNCDGRCLTAATVDVEGDQLAIGRGCKLRDIGMRLSHLSRSRRYRIEQHALAAVGFAHHEYAAFAAVLSREKMRPAAR